MYTQVRQVTITASKPESSVNPRGQDTAEEKNPDFDPTLTLEIEGR